MLCPSFPWFFGLCQGKPHDYQGFSVPAEPAESLEKTEKTPKNNRGNSSLKFAKEVQKTKEKKDRSYKTKTQEFLTDRKVGRNNTQVL